MSHEAKLASSRNRSRNTVHSRRLLVQRVKLNSPASQRPPIVVQVHTEINMFPPPRHLFIPLCDRNIETIFCDMFNSARLVGRHEQGLRQIKK